jgi:hypothetical protein
MEGVARWGARPAHAAVLDDIGVTAVRELNPGLTGTGVTVVQAEASTVDGQGNDLNNFAVNPDNVPTAVAITYFNSEGYPGATGSSFAQLVALGLGSESVHADEVARAFYGTTSGVVPTLAGVLNYNANYFVNNVIAASASINAKIVNQSFVFGNDPDHPELGPIVDQLYDNYVGTHGTIIVTAAGNGPTANMTQVQVPGSAYNVITVGAMGIVPGSSGTSPPSRSKPDITAPGDATSYTTPLVSGVAAMLVQAGNEQVAGVNKDSVDPRTVKVLLMTGALKPVGWTHTASAPLDPQYGAGEVNALKSYRILTSGEHRPTVTNTTMAPVSSGTSLGMGGWNVDSLRSVGTDAVDHYLLDLPGTGPLTLSATLTWYRGFNLAVAPGDPDAQVNGISNGDLFLYDAVTGTQIALSTSVVDNVEHLYLPSLKAGLYDLQVVARPPSPENDGDLGLIRYAVAWMANYQGDANFDGAVDALDLNVLANHWLQGGKLWTEGDFTGDGEVNALDLNALALNWQAGTSFSTALAQAAAANPAFAGVVDPTAVPEAGSLALLALGIGAGLMRRRSGRAA